MKLSQSQLTKLTLVNTVLLLCMGAYLIYSHDMNEPEAIPFTQNSDVKPAGSDLVGTPHKTLIKDILDATIEPLIRAAKDHNQSVDGLIPSQRKLDLAIESGSLKSDESKAILAKLEEGYSRFNMPFPKLPEIKTEARELQEKEIHNELVQLTAKLQKELEARSERGGDVVPSPSELKAAASSASYDSPETQLVMKKLKAGYQRVGLNFPSDTKTDAARELRGFFQAQVFQLETKAKALGKDVSSCLPQSSTIEQAVLSGKKDSPAAERFDAELKDCYSKLGIVAP